MKLASWIGQSNNSSKTLPGILMFAVMPNGNATPPPPTSYHIDSPSSESVVLSFGCRDQLKKMDTMICDEHIGESTDVLLF